MPSRAMGGVITASAGSATTDSGPSAAVGMASGLGVQMAASAQLGTGEPGCIRELWGTAPCSGISHSWAARSEKPRQAAAPRAGCSCSNSTRPARRDFTV